MTVIGYAFYSTFALTEKDKLMLKKILLLALLPAIAFAEELPAPVKAIENRVLQSSKRSMPLEE